METPQLCWGGTHSAGSAAIGAGVTATENKLTGSCNSVSQTAITGAVFGGVGAGIGLGLANGVNAVNRNVYNNLPLSVRTLFGSNALHGVRPAPAVPVGMTAGNIVSNITTNIPSYQAISD